MGLDELKALVVIVVVGIHIGIERTGVDQERYRATSSRSIASMRTETS